ncbi:MAG: MipA/OmpV family protein [Rickettsiales bacterium]|jgi:outer membrane scaffolding protein for murein synthesis (MipA/OmpV family)|nr:MipA/OmpV family protein [Rickettsiales bacterium]
MKKSHLHLIPLAASFAIIASGGAHAEELLPPSRYAEQRYYPAQNPKPEYAVQNPVQYGQPQQYAQLDISRQQQQAINKSAQIGEDDDFDGEPKKHGWNFEVGAVAMYSPAYEGSDKHEVEALPNISVDYEDGLFFANPYDGIGSYPIQGEDYKLGAAIGLDFGRDESDDRKNLRGMGDIDMSPTANLMGEYEFGPIEISGKLTKGNSDYGMTAEADVGTMFEVTDRLMVMSKVGATWANEDHMNTYFGVSNAQSGRSGYSSYKASSGIKSVGLEVGAVYSVTKNIDATLMVEADQLLGDAADSPLTKKDFQPSVMIGTSYKF